MSTLHITNGDHAGDTLRLVVDGPVTIAADVLHEGPCPPIDGDAWHRARARFLATDGGRAVEDVRATLAARDAAVADAAARGDAMVLWFEHDLFDQLAIIRTLDLMVRLKPDTTETGETQTRETGTGNTETRETKTRESETRASSVVSGFSRTAPRVSLICIDRFPGVERFVGLGQLTPDELATLAGSGVPVTAGHFRLAADAWRAFRSPDPEDLLALAGQLSAARSPSSEGGPALPFLGPALFRFLAEFPSVANGLSQTEELALDALLAGATTTGALFRAAQAGEPAPFMGDTVFFDILRRLAAARVPLVTLDAGPAGGDPRRVRVAITGAGREVLAGRADHVGLNGIDLWRGGVHLAGSDRSPWRWDARAETLVS